MQRCCVASSALPESLSTRQAQEPAPRPAAHVAQSPSGASSQQQGPACPGAYGWLAAQGKLTTCWVSPFHVPQRPLRRALSNRLLPHPGACCSQQFLQRSSSSWRVAFSTRARRPPPRMQAMDGSMSLEDALEQRLAVINCTPADIQAFLRAHPPESRLTPVGPAAQPAQPRACRCAPCQPACRSVRSAWGALRLRGAAASRHLMIEGHTASLACAWPGRVFPTPCAQAPLPAALHPRTHAGCWSVQGARELIQQLQARGVAVYLIRWAGMEYAQSVLPCSLQARLGGAEGGSMPRRAVRAFVGASPDAAAPLNTGGWRKPLARAGMHLCDCDRGSMYQPPRSPPPAAAASGSCACPSAALWGCRPRTCLPTA